MRDLPSAHEGEIGFTGSQFGIGCKSVGEPSFLKNAEQWWICNRRSRGICEKNSRGEEIILIFDLSGPWPSEVFWQPTVANRGIAGVGHFVDRAGLTPGPPKTSAVLSMVVGKNYIKDHVIPVMTESDRDDYVRVILSSLKKIAQRT